MRKLGICAVVAVGAGVLAAIAVAAGGGNSTTAYDTTVTITDQQPASISAICPPGAETRGLGVSAKGTSPQNDSLGIGGLGRSGDNSAVATVRPQQSAVVFLSPINYCSERGPRVRAREETRSLVNPGGADKPGVVSASCKSGEKLLFGGFETEEDDNNVYLAGQYRSGQAWKTAVYNFGPASDVSSTAYCAEGKSKLTTAKSRVRVPAGALKTATAKCKSGRRVVFGGYKGTVTDSKAFVLLRSSRRVGTRKWEVKARNQNADDGGSLTAYAYCVKT